MFQFSNHLSKLQPQQPKKVMTNYINARQIQKQSRVFNQLRNEIQNAENILKQGIDYAEFTRELGRNN
jgi:Cdc6-like AAA superfamily ATPase